MRFSSLAVKGGLTADVVAAIAIATVAVSRLHDRPWTT
jgi:hypothetical protein